MSIIQVPCPVEDSIPVIISWVDLNFRSDDVITFKLHSCVPKTLVIKHANFEAIRTNFATDVVMYAYF